MPSHRPPSWRSKAAQLGLFLVALFLGFTGFSLAAGATSQALTVLGLGNSSIEQLATVTRIESSRLDDASGNATRTVDLPVLSFRYLGHPYEFVAQAVSGDRHFAVGETVPVVFPPGAPEDAVLSELRHASWAVPLFLGLALLTGTAFFAWAVWQLHLVNFGRPRP